LNDGTDVPRLPAMHGSPEPLVKDRSSSSSGGSVDDDDDESDEDDQRWRKPRRHATIEQKVQDPYASDDPGSMLLPVVVAVGAFIPLLFCLCRL